MHFQIYYSKNDELEIKYLLDFLKEKRGIVNMPDIPAGQPKLLACHNGQEIYFQRDYLSIGHFIIEEYNRKNHSVTIRHLPKFFYGLENPADKIIDKPITD